MSADPTQTTPPARNGRLALGIFDLSHLLVGLCCMAGGGGIGTYATQGDLAGELRETRAMVMGGLERLEDKLDDHGRRLTAVEALVHEHERAAGHPVTIRRLDEIERRLDNDNR